MLYTQQKSLKFNLTQFVYVYFVSENVIPRDSTLIMEVEVVIPAYLYVLMACLAGLGIMLALCLLAFNISHRENV